MIKPHDSGGIADPRGCLALLLLAAAGSADARPDVGQVSGMVRLDDQVLCSGTITWSVVFVSQNGDKTAGLVGNDGKYQLKDVPVGRAKVAIHGQPRVPRGLRGPQDPPSGLEQADLRLLNSLTKFKDPDKSGLVYTVKKGKQDQDIELK